jgi:hypothetical protein
MTAVLKACRLVARISLGLFILWQVVFLWASFFVKVEESLREQAASQWSFMSERFPGVLKGEDGFHQGMNYVQKHGLRRYAQATAQHQSWSLFAPSVAEAFSFAAVEFRWDEDRLEPGLVEPYALPPIHLPGVNEPADVNSFFRYKNFRIRRYEMQIAPTPALTDGMFDPKSQRWRDRIVSCVDEDGDNMLAYLRWRWQAYHRQHPALPPPTQIILHIRGYGIPEPPGPSPWVFDSYGQYPVARWLPWKADQSGTKALERYNPLTDCYESVP